jgi:hypothetical protein
MPRQEWGGIEPMGKIFLLTFLFIGLADFSLFIRMDRATESAKLAIPCRLEMNLKEKRFRLFASKFQASLNQK